MIQHDRHTSVLMFDLGGVLVHTRGFESVKELLGRACQGDDLDDQSLRDRWLDSPAVRDFELGRVTALEFSERFIEEWQVSTTPEEFLEDVADWIDHVYPGAEELLDSLRHDHVLCCLSNSNELHWSTMASFLKNFDFTFSSHLLGRIKPDEDAFRAALDALGVRPAQVRLFDDSRANVVAAEKLGIRSYLVRGPGEVRTALEREGLL